VSGSDISIGGPSTDRVLWSRSLRRDYRSFLEEWLYHFHDGTSRIAGSTGFSVRSVYGEPGTLELSPHGVGIRLRIAVRSLQDLDFSLIGSPATTSEEVGAMVALVERADALLHVADRDFDWAAIVGPDTSTHRDCHVRLGERCTVGPLQLEPAAKPYGEWTRYSIGHQSTSLSFPFIVRGTSRSYATNAAMAQGAEALFRLCALLTVEWNVIEHVAHWILREGPRSTAEPVRVAVPGSEDTAFGGYGTPRVLGRPSWSDRAWALVDGDRSLDRALLVFYEGERLRAKHPSFAMIAFIAALEHLGERITGTLGADGKPVPSREKLRAGLRLVATEERARELASEGFSPRSATAHAGALYGDEKQFNLSVLTKIIRDEPGLFLWQRLPLFRNLARQALFLVLGPEDSPKGD
jgi:hypothetical protein